MINYKPIGYRLLVKIDAVEDKEPDGVYKTKGGIFLPEETIKQEQLAQVRGVVIAVGGDAFNDSKDKVRKDDIVLFQRYSGMRVVQEDGTFIDDLVIMNDRDITCIIESVPDEE